ncbi:hypothetical protein XELAEV_18037452mg [Xenopus laevis]|uniref:Uncharacterized protein n=1 Tax=Xenopus laevis TaxID=8355 RepID=A0A974CDF2_XENLA|nr:hypothetical protein XELAEV_18037452mg [Xenopus laevis]
MVTPTQCFHFYLAMCWGLKCSFHGLHIILYINYLFLRFFKHCHPLSCIGILHSSFWYEKTKCLQSDVKYIVLCYMVMRYRASTA